MDTIEKALHYAETGQRPVEIDENEPTEIYDAIDELKNNASISLIGGQPQQNSDAPSLHEVISSLCNLQRMTKQS